MAQWYSQVVVIYKNYELNESLSHLAERHGFYFGYISSV